MTDYLIAIDVGTVKTVAVAGKKEEPNSNRVEIVAYGETPSEGIKRGQVENILDVIRVVRNTLEQLKANTKIAEQISDVREVYVGVAGLNIRYLGNRAELLRQVYEKTITEDEIDSLEIDACKFKLNAGEEIIHAIPQIFNIDDSKDEITDPVGRLGRKIVGNFMIIIERSVVVQHTTICMEKLNLSLRGFILEHIAAARATLSENEKDLGVVLLDIGGETTNLSIFVDKILKHVEVIRFGGNIITQSIKSAYHITLRDAESVKLEFGSCIPSNVADDEVVVVPGIHGRKDTEIPVDELAKLIENRMSELISPVKTRMKSYNGKLNAGIVCTGGGAMIGGLSEFIRDETGMNTRIASPIYVSATSPQQIIHPEYSTAVGLLMCGFDYAKKKRETSKKFKFTNLLNNFRNIFYIES
jgi:cell division protein FtsA